MVMKGTGLSHDLCHNPQQIPHPPSLPLDTKRHLCEPELKLMRPAGKILQAVARASDPACVSVISTVVPLLVQQFTQNVQVGHVTVM